MLRALLLFAGFVLLLCLHFIHQVPEQVQGIVFLLGIGLLGIPHGAADLLVASQNQMERGRSFSVKRFLISYIKRLLLAAVFLWLFPWVGIVLFVIFAAYHFGETDLYFLRTQEWTGRILIVSYGWMILNVILFNNLPELAKLLTQSGLSRAALLVDEWAYHRRLAVLSISLLFFFVTVFLYFLTNKKPVVSDQFLLQFAILVFLLYHLPLILGFTFYFVLWHSVLSLRNIVCYIRERSGKSNIAILKQILLYSGLAMAGILISGSFVLGFVNGQTWIMWVFAGLAVLTVPHMLVMHAMYHWGRIKEKPLVRNNLSVVS